MERIEIIIIVSICLLFIILLVLGMLYIYLSDIIYKPHTRDIRIADDEYITSNGKGYYIGKGSPHGYHNINPKQKR
jgi:hypothetical protein